MDFKHIAEVQASLSRHFKQRERATHQLRASLRSNLKRLRTRVQEAKVTSASRTRMLTHREARRNRATSCPSSNPEVILSAGSHMAMFEDRGRGGYRPRLRRARDEAGCGGGRAERETFAKVEAKMTPLKCFDPPGDKNWQHTALVICDKCQGMKIEPPALPAGWKEFPPEPSGPYPHAAYFFHETSKQVAWKPPEGSDMSSVVAFRLTGTCLRACGCEARKNQVLQLWQSAGHRVRLQL